MLVVCVGIWLSCGFVFNSVSQVTLVVACVCDWTPYSVCFLFSLYISLVAGSTEGYGGLVLFWCLELLVDDVVVLLEWLAGKLDDSHGMLCCFFLTPGVIELVSCDALWEILD